MAFKNWNNLISEEELDAQIARAKAATQEADATEPRAASVRFDRSSELIIISLKNGAFFSFPPTLVQGLGDASPEDLDDVWLDASGSSVHWERLDADFNIAGLVAGIFGTKAWMSHLGLLLPLKPNHLVITARKVVAPKSCYKRVYKSSRNNPLNNNHFATIQLRRKNLAKSDSSIARQIGRPCGQV